MTVRCPTCKKPVQSGTADFPFCSERCRLIDLGRWADEEYRIPAEAASPIALEKETGQRNGAPKSSGRQDEQT